MSPNEEINDDLLGRWLSGELSEEEKNRIEGLDELETYKVIAQYTDQLQAPEYDSNAAYQKLRDQLPDKKGKVIKMASWKIISVAASVALLIGFGWIYLNSTSTTPIEFYTAKGETKNVILPDHSEVAMNISSKISFNESTWNEQRLVNLNGEAYFKVTKGSDFKVITSHGTIAVLGTEFNIRNRGDLTEVVCYEGKVSVTDLSDNKVILSPSDAARIVDGKLQNDWHPIVNPDADWKNGFSSFHIVELPIVIEELENQYNITITKNTEITDRSYNGAFPHDNLNKALELVFAPMQLEYTLTNDSTVVIQ